MKVYWLSRHELSPAQRVAIRHLHGKKTEIVQDPVVFESHMGLVEYIKTHEDGFVYAVAGASHYISAALEGSLFGIFENYPGKRADGTFGLAAVYHVVTNYEEWDHNVAYGSILAPWKLERVWVNPDPESDQGEALVPITR